MSNSEDTSSDDGDGDSEDDSSKYPRKNKSKKLSDPEDDSDSSSEYLRKNKNKKRSKIEYNTEIFKQFKSVKKLLGDNSQYVCIGGGSVFTAFQNKSNDIKDFDLFIYSCSEEKAVEIISSFSKKYSAKYIDEKGNLILNTNCVTLNKIGNRKDQLPVIQFILRLYNSLSEIIHGFDLDACCILYTFDGEIYTTERGFYSLKHKTNFFNFDRMSPSREYRDIKYVDKGIKLWIPAKQHFLDNIIWDLSSIERPYRGGNIFNIDFVMNYFKNYISIGSAASDYNGNSGHPYVITDDNITQITISNYIIQNVNKINNDVNVLNNGSQFVAFNTQDVVLDEKIFKNIKFKINNPSEQSIGTFQRIIMEDNLKWFPEKYTNIFIPPNKDELDNFFPIDQKFLVPDIGIKSESNELYKVTKGYFRNLYFNIISGEKATGENKKEKATGENVEEKATGENVEEKATGENKKEKATGENKKKKEKEGKPKKGKKDNTENTENIKKEEENLYTVQKYKNFICPYIPFQKIRAVPNEIIINNFLKKFNNEIVIGGTYALNFLSGTKVHGTLDFYLMNSPNNIKNSKTILKDFIRYYIYISFRELDFEYVKSEYEIGEGYVQVSYEIDYERCQFYEAIFPVIRVYTKKFESYQEIMDIYEYDFNKVLLVSSKTEKIGEFILNNKTKYCIINKMHYSSFIDISTIKKTYFKYGYRFIILNEPILLENVYYPFTDDENFQIKLEKVQAKYKSKSNEEHISKYNDRDDTPPRKKYNDKYNSNEESDDTPPRKKYNDKYNSDEESDDTPRRKKYNDKYNSDKESDD